MDALNLEILNKYHYFGLISCYLKNIYILGISKDKLIVRYSFRVTDMIKIIIGAFLLITLSYTNKLH